MEESLFNRLMGKLQPNEDMTVKEFTEEDYWMSSREVCEYLHITKSILNAYKFYKLLFHIQIKGIHHYKRAEVYKLKAQMDVEMLDGGQLLDCVRLIETEREAVKAVEEKPDEAKAEKKPLWMRFTSWLSHINP
jgi:hypothetical protein